MIRIAALNSDSSDDESFGYQVEATTTKEAQEAESLALYNKALSFQKHGNLKSAANAFRQLLESPYIKKASQGTEEDAGLVDPALMLKYSAYKNLAGLYREHGDSNLAMENYLKAVNIDGTDVTVWHKIGTLALQLHNYSLARHAFEQGLECNPRHWPCLDNVITVLFALGNYAVCLYYISKALLRDNGYLKGLVIMKQIFKEHAALEKDTSHLFEDCDLEEVGEIKEEEAKQFIDEALEMRAKKHELAEEEPLPVVTFVPPLSSYSWKSLGEALVNIYDKVNHQKIKGAKLTCRVDLSSYQEPKLLTEASPAAVVLAADNAPVLLEEKAGPHSQPLLTAPTQPVVAVSTPVEAPIEGSEDTIHVIKRGPKRKKLAGDDPGGKRRSARVRNTSKRKEEDEVNFKDLLMRILPLSLQQVKEEQENECQTQPMDLTVNVEAGKEATSATRRPSEGSPLGSTEQTDVHSFLLKCQDNGGVLDIMTRYLTTLSAKFDMKWPFGLGDIYMKVYQRLRKHIEYPAFLCKDEPDESIRDMAHMCLVQGELKLDKWLHIKTKSPGGSPRKSPVMSTITLGQDFPGKYFPGDLHYLIELTTCKDILLTHWLSFCVRVCWLWARFLILEGKMEFASDIFNRCAVYLGMSSESEELRVTLRHCAVENIITVEEVNKQQEQLQRCQSLEELQKLQEAGDHQRVVELLLQTFQQPTAKGKVMDAGGSERYAQLLLLQESLLKLEDYQRCLEWSEMSFNEALQQYNVANSTSMKEDWNSTMSQLFQGMDTCLEKDLSYIKQMEPKHVVRLTQNLIHVLGIAMDASDTPEMPLNAVIPWIILYRLVKYEEERVKSVQLDQETDTEDSVPSSVMLLSIAHDYLGRRAWCTNCDGVLLHFIVDTLSAEVQRSSLDEPQPQQQEAEQMIEQCFYCLYGHPNKRGKAKHLEDHNAAQIPLVWSRAIQVFEFFKPKTVPEFDSYKTSTVSSELENLLRRIAALVPVQKDPAITVESISAYVEGLLPEPPWLPKDYVPLPIVKELFYLLGDYYFKNKEQAKAIKFYMHDICENPERFDSWAGMALARMSRLEQKLNSHELKPESPVQKQAMCALRCFKRALELDDSNGKLWIEYGSMAYQLHSHATRQLKQLTVFPLSPELLQLATENKRDMLKVAHSCYVTASNCEAEDYAEEWLHNYMLGKVAEKMQRHPSEYLKFYQKASGCLHEEHAQYPKKITYIYSPPHLAMESLEVFYRLHVSILKYLINNEEKVPYELFEKYLTQAAEGPFALMKEKKKERRDSAKDVGSSADESIHPTLPDTPASTVITKPPKAFRGARPDHTYSKKRQYESSSSADESSVDTAKPVTSQMVSKVVMGASCNLHQTHNALEDAITSTASCIHNLMESAIQDDGSVKKDMTQSLPSQAPNTASTVAATSCSSASGTTLSASDVPMDTVDKTSESHVDVNLPTGSISCDLVTVNTDSSVNAVDKSVSPTNKKEPAAINDAVSLPNKNEPAVKSDAVLLPNKNESAVKSDAFSLTNKHGSPVASYAVSLTNKNESPVTNDANKLPEETDRDLKPDHGVPLVSREKVHSTDLATSDPLDTQGKCNNLESQDMKRQGLHMDTGTEGTDHDMGKEESADPADSRRKEDDQAGLLSRHETQPFVPAVEDALVGSAPYESASVLSNRTSMPDFKVKKQDSDVNNGSDSVKFYISSSELTDTTSSENGKSGKTSPYTSSENEKSAKNSPCATLSENEKSGKTSSCTMSSRNEASEENFPCKTIPEKENSSRTPPCTMSSKNEKSGTHSPDMTSPDYEENGKTSPDGSTTSKSERASNCEYTHIADSVSKTKSNIHIEEICLAIPIKTENSRDEMLVTVNSEIQDMLEDILSRVEKSANSETNTDVNKQNSVEDDVRNVIEYALSMIQAKEELDKEEKQRQGNIIGHLNDKESWADMEEKSTADDTGGIDPMPNLSLMGVGGVSIDSNAEDKVMPILDSVHLLGDSVAESKLSTVEGATAANESEKHTNKSTEAPPGSNEQTESKELGHDSEKRPHLQQLKSDNDCKADGMDIETPQLGPCKSGTDISAFKKPIVTGAHTEHQDDTDDKGSNELSLLAAPDTQEGASKVTVRNTEAMKKADSDDRCGINQNTDRKTNEPDGNNDAFVSKLPTEPAAKHKCLVEMCLKGLEIILSRFPHHYKSLYRLAFVYYHLKSFKDLTKSKNILLGHQSWSDLSYMPCPGLFQDRRQTNFFNGLWRIPIEEIDRSGSFATHISKSTTLLYEVLKDLQDHKKLFQVYRMMQRIPEQGKKYIRDCDRLHLASRALTYTLDVLEGVLERTAQELEMGESVLSLLIDIYKVWQYAIKADESNKLRANLLLEKVYRLHSHDQVMTASQVTENAIRFCQQHQAQQQKVVSEERQDSKVIPGAAKALNETTATLSGAAAALKTLAMQVNPQAATKAGAATEGAAGVSAAGKQYVHIGSEDVQKMVKPCSVRIQSPASSPGRARSPAADQRPRSPLHAISAKPTSAASAGSQGDSQLTSHTPHMQQVARPLSSSTTASSALRQGISLLSYKPFSSTSQQPSMGQTATIKPKTVQSGHSVTAKQQGTTRSLTKTELAASVEFPAQHPKQIILGSDKPEIIEAATKKSLSTSQTTCIQQILFSGKSHTVGITSAAGVSATQKSSKPLTSDALKQILLTGNVDIQGASSSVVLGQAKRVHSLSAGTVIADPQAPQAKKIKLGDLGVATIEPATLYLDSSESSSFVSPQMSSTPQARMVVGTPRQTVDKPPSLSLLQGSTPEVVDISTPESYRSAQSSISQTGSRSILSQQQKDKEDEPYEVVVLSSDSGEDSMTDSD